MTVSIYQNPFVFEKRGQAFSNYIGLMIKHFNDKKDELGLTTRHHIKSKFLTSNEYDNSPWNVVHLLHEVHVEAHNYLKEAMPNEKGAIGAVNRLKGGCPRLAAQERWENPEYIEKQSESQKKSWEDPDRKVKGIESIKKSWEDPDRKVKASEGQKKRYEDPNERLKSSEVTTNCWKDPEFAAKTRESLKKSWANPNRKKREKIRCEYCGKEFDPGNFAQHHGPNCKCNPNRIA